MKNIDPKETNALVCIGTGSDAGSIYRRAVLPNASFVTQLIATAAALPQTRKLQRAMPVAALNGYKSVSMADPQRTARVGIRLSRVA